MKVYYSMSTGCDPHMKKGVIILITATNIEYV